MSWLACYSAPAPQAHVVKGFLEQRGVPCVLKHEGPTMYPLAAFGTRVHVLVPEDWPRFQARLRDRDRPVSLPMMVDVASWLLETYTQRPLEMPSSSGNGQSNTGTKSTAASPSKGKTRSPSTRAVSSTPSV